MYHCRKASLFDIDFILNLIEEYVQSETLIPVNRDNITESIRDYTVVVDKDNSIIGVVALHIYTTSIAEIRTLVVSQKYQKQGIGKTLVQKCIKEAIAIGIRKVFALTKSELFFKSLGFQTVSKDDLPEKAYRDCICCSKLHHCDEIPVLKVIS